MLHLTAILITWLVIPIAFATPVQNDVPNVIVRLRVVDGSETIFDQLVRTNGHNVTTASGGTHHCDGTNNQTYPTPVPTATAALDDASKVANFTWDGTWYPKYDDFFITQIAGIPPAGATLELQYSSEHWAIEVNSRYIDVGGCQERVHEGDDVLFTFIDAPMNKFRLGTGPQLAHVDAPDVLGVTDAKGGIPIAGALAGEEKSHTNGYAPAQFDGPGLKSLAGEEDSSSQSNINDEIQMVVMDESKFLELFNFACADNLMLEASYQDSNEFILRRMSPCSIV